MENAHNVRRTMKTLSFQYNCCRQAYPERRDGEWLWFETIFASRQLECPDKCAGVQTNHKNSSISMAFYLKA